MSEKVEMALVQGTVTFRVNLDMLVDSELARDEGRLREFMVDKAFKEIDSSDDDFDYDNEVHVLISKETADKYRNELVDHDEWRSILKEHKGEKSEG
jgi:hypothetical protein